MTENEIKWAKEQFKNSDCTLVLWKEGKTFSFNERGVKPLLDLIDKKADVQGFSVMDKIVGKAAAFLDTILKVKEVYAFVATKDAEKVLKDAGIAIQYETLISAIQNRGKTGLCPMETAVQNAKNANEAVKAIRKKLSEIQKR